MLVTVTADSVHCVRCYDREKFKQEIQISFRLAFIIIDPGCGHVVARKPLSNATGFYWNLLKYKRICSIFSTADNVKIIMLIMWLMFTLLPSKTNCAADNNSVTLFVYYYHNHKPHSRIIWYLIIAHCWKFRSSSAKCGCHLVFQVVTDFLGGCIASIFTVKWLRYIQFTLPSVLQSLVISYFWRCSNISLFPGGTYISPTFQIKFSLVFLTCSNDKILPSGLLFAVLWTVDSFLNVFILIHLVRK
jgi:hypothetical protein